MLAAKDKRFMKALTCSPEFATRQKLLHDYGMRQQEAETPVLVEDDLDEDHLHCQHDEAEDHPMSLINSLVAMGVTRYDAINAVSRMTSNVALTPATVCEVYGRGEIVRQCNEARRDLNLNGAEDS